MAATQEYFGNDDIVARPPMPKGNGDGHGFFQPPAPAADGVLASDQARAVAEVQAALVIAAGRPRNEFKARERLLQACQRVSLARTALYNYPRGGTSVTGPSIRLAEASARVWGNMTYGFRELSRRDGASECEAFAWDLESNTKAVRQFSVKHWRDTKSGGYALKEERDIYEFIANQAQRRVRAAILEIIPGDIIEDAVEECEKTLRADVGDLGESVKNMLARFNAFGVSKEAIEKRLGHRIDAIQPAQIINLGKIYRSLKDGMSEPKDWFDLEEAPAKASQPAAAKPEKKPKAEVKADKTAQGEAPQAPESQPDPPAPEAGPDSAQDEPPETPITRETLAEIQAELKRRGEPPDKLPPKLAAALGTGDPSELNEGEGRFALAALKDQKE